MFLKLPAMAAGVSVCAAPVHVCSMAACAIPGRVCFTAGSALLDASVLLLPVLPPWTCVFSVLEACAAPGRVCFTSRVCTVFVLKQPVQSVLSPRTRLGKVSLDSVRTL